MNIQKQFFSDSPNGAVYRYILENETLRVGILTLGGIVQSLSFHGKETVLGFEDANGYLQSSCYYGAIVGRCCGRQYDLTVGDSVFPLSKNENGAVHLHGGFHGFDRKLWQAETEQNALVLSCTSPDGEEGYPGTLSVRVRYLLSENTLAIRYEAISDRDTAVNLTNHTYFNLNGLGGTVEDHTVCIPSRFVSVCDGRHVPTGEHFPVAGTVLDLQTPRRIGDCLNNPMLALYGGFDHTYLLQKQGGVSQAALVSGKDLSLEVWTDQPCLQFYTANDAHDAPMRALPSQFSHRAFCIETQKEPCSVGVCKAGVRYQTVTEYRFRERRLRHEKE